MESIKQCHDLIKRHEHLINLSIYDLQKKINRQYDKLEVTVTVEDGEVRLVTNIDTAMPKE